MTFVLASFCNQGIGNPPLGLVDLDTGLSQPVDVGEGDVFTCTGLARADDAVVVAHHRMGAPYPELAFLDATTLEVRGRVHLELAADPHSLAWHDGALYVASTGTDEILKVRIDGHRVLSEEVVWRPPPATDRVDRHHVNCVAFHQGRLYAVAFWSKTAPLWSTATDGRVIEVETGRVFCRDLHHPHSLTAIGDALCVSESASRTIRRVDGSRRVAVSGYARGLCAAGPQMLVGTSKRRLMSRSTGMADAITIDSEALADSVVTGTCGVTVVDGETFEIRSFINLEHLSAEIYDLLPMENVVRPPSLPWYHAEASLPERTPLYAIDPMLDGPPRPVNPGAAK